jgi:hypothetical protein
MISLADVAVRRLASITVSVDLRLADSLNPAAAGFGVTATTSAGRPYPSVSHPWTRRFYQAGFDGVRYGAAHHPPELRSLTPCSARPAKAPGTVPILMDRFPTSWSRRHGPNSAWSSGEPPHPRRSSGGHHNGSGSSNRSAIDGGPTGRGRRRRRSPGLPGSQPAGMYAKCMQTPCHGSETGGRGRTRPAQSPCSGAQGGTPWTQSHGPSLTGG